MTEGKSELYTLDDRGVLEPHISSERTAPEPTALAQIMPAVIRGLLSISRGEVDLREEVAV